MVRSNVQQLPIRSNCSEIIDTDCLLMFIYAEKDNLFVSRSDLKFYYLVLEQQVKASFVLGVSSRQPSRCNYSNTTLLLKLSHFCGI